MNNKSILITGGAGFIGSQLALFIQSNFINTNIVILDKFNNLEKLTNGNYKFLGSYKNLTGYKGIIIQGDIRDESLIAGLEKFNFDYIFHLAAISDTRAEDESEVIDVNLNSFAFLVALAERCDAKLVYASSGSTYGSAEVNLQRIGEERPDNIYGFSKLMMDVHAAEYSKDKSVKIVGLRYFNVYGYGESNKFKTASMILQFANQFLYGDGPKLFEQSHKIFRDFIYIEDVIKFTINAAILPVTGVYNVGTGFSRSFLEVAEIIKRELKSDKNFYYIKNPYTLGYQNYTRADVSKSISELEYRPMFSLEDGIKSYIERMKEGE